MRTITRQWSFSHLDDDNDDNDVSFHLFNSLCFLSRWPVLLFRLEMRVRRTQINLAALCRLP